MTNYTITSNSDITNLKISDGAYRCYMLLQSMCYGDKTTCYPSIKYIAIALGRSCRTINRYIKELVSLKLIIKRRRGSISNLYVLVQKKVNNAVDRLKQAVKGKKDNAQNSYKNKNNNYNYKNNQRTDFNDYPQRNYNYNKLEELLLYGKGSLSECEI
ncbi:helix-turn-helix domain-containing protein [Clostridium novyi]|uniref:helix-turn-helix domain-containing protein n=1 Tax=Clostridium novyi TaxID=1542 RepID=UPI0004D68FE7|nr:helix-turn-helix domain-containing protein [Clostridium novyi]KEH88986.1 transcriptional regulator [Clostridium novyi A str. 4540]